jgi:subtilisin family serine protease
MVLKVSDKYGNTNSLDIWRALHYAADKGAKIINISLGDKGMTQLEQLGINYAYSKGALIIVAAGNQGSYVSSYGPPAARRALPVAALNIEGTRSIISNWGPNIALTAPGEDIYSLHSKDAEWKGPSMDRVRRYYATSGTSLSAPIVAGTASLMLTKNPALTNTQLEDILLETAADLRDEGWDAYTGAGLLDAYAALKRSPGNILTLRPTEVIVNRQKEKISSVDIFGIIRGNLDSYVVELGEGKQPKEWVEVASSKTPPPDYGFITRIDGKLVSTKSDYMVRIKAKDRSGKISTAQLLLPLKNEK